MWGGQNFEGRGRKELGAAVVIFLKCCPLPVGNTSVATLREFRADIVLLKALE